MREKLQESVAEVSGAVEIDSTELAAFEQGADRPSEDILLLLISHFGVKEEEAGQLWKLAGYDKEDFIIDANQDGDKPPVFVMPGDARIAYTDMVHIMVNNYGVVMNFMQGPGPNNQPMIVSRIGMSREHAQSMLELLQRTLNTSPKSLPESGSEPKKSK